MAELREPTFTVEIEGFRRFGNNQEFGTNIKSYNIDSSYFVATDGWSFTVHDEDEPALLRRVFKPLQPVKIYIDDALQVVGRIDKTEGTGDGSALMVSGRDYIADLVDGSADPAVRFKKGVDIGDAILQVTRVFGVVSIFAGFSLTRDLLTGKQPFVGEARDFKEAKHDEFKVSYNQGAWQVIEKIAARHGFTIQPTQDRSSIALAEPQYGQPALYTLHRTIDGLNTNVLTGKATRDYSKVPSFTIAQGRGGRGGGKISGLNVFLPSFGEDAPTVLGRIDEVQRIVFSEDFRRPLMVLDRLKPGFELPPNAGLLYRPMYYQDTDSRNRDQLERGARRMIAERMRDTLTYRCTVRGHSDPQSGAIYAQDTIANIKDEIEDVDEVLWLQERTLRNDGSGPETDLVFIRPDSYLL